MTKLSSDIDYKTLTYKHKDNFEHFSFEQFDVYKPIEIYRLIENSKLLLEKTKECQKRFKDYLSFTIQEKKFLVCFLTIPNKYLKLGMEQFKEKESQYYHLSKLLKYYK